jgi:hypothetical protein
VDELGEARSHDHDATQPGANGSLPELVRHTTDRHATSVRTTAGLALTIASLGMLSVFVWGAMVPFHYERSTPPLGEVCYTDGATATTLGCFYVDQDRLDQAFEDDINHSNRVIGTVGAITSCTGLLLGLHLWRGHWRQRKHVGRKARTVVVAACLSPVAAIPIVVATGGLYWCYSSTFE